MGKKMRKTILSGVAATAIAGCALGLLAGPASASVPARSATVIAKTSITGRPDSGGNGNWATDAMTRTLTIRHLRGDSYTAILDDTSGTFVTGRGDFVPNQAAAPGATFTQRITGTFAGSASFSFTASRSPSGALVPPRATGSGPTDTSHWYKLAFPAGTTFGGTGILNDWGWSYQTSQGCLTVSRAGFAVQHQFWNDFASDNGGQGPGLPAAGHITNFPRSCLLF
jgi:hypothetical protein